MSEIIKPIKERKVFVPAGVISLIFLPPLCFIYFYYHNSFQKYSVLELNYLGSKALKKMNPRFRPVLPQREFHQIELTGDSQGDRIKLEYVQIYIREMVARKDTVRGIHLILRDQAKYANMVKAIDISRIGKLDYSWIDESGIWYYEMPETPFDELVAGLSHCIVLPETEPVEQSWFQFMREQLSILKRKPLLVMAFVLLSIINLLQLKAYLKVYLNY